ncbi:MAG: hypothetical protein CMD13_02565 [Flavobacteriales bacterium]|nr:hypothetical protein [Flavobacteriales bacterium]|tara:strand:+ start:1327 stop:2613 length:1287 start_codon:yes stop_codon:yes gene_type:complete
MEKLNNYIIKSTLIILIGTILTSGSNFLFYVIAGNLLSVSEFGEISSIISIIGFSTLISNFGVPHLWLKLFAKEGNNGKRWINPSLKFLSFSALLTFLFVNLWSILGPHTAQSEKIFFLISSLIFQQLIVDIIAVKFQLENNFSKMIFWQSIPSVTRTVLLIFASFLLSELNQLTIGYIYFFVSIFFILASVLNINEIRKGSINLDLVKNDKSDFIDDSSVKNLIFFSSPFALSLILSYIFNQSDIIMLNYFSSNTSTGYYNASYLIFSTFILLPTMIYNKYYLPYVHRWSYNNSAKLKSFSKNHRIILLLLGITAFLFLNQFSQFIIEFVFGSNYDESIDLLKILSFGLPFVFMTFASSILLFTKDNIYIKTIFMAIVSSLKIILNLVFIPQYGHFAAAYSTLVCNILLFLLYSFYVNKFIVNNEKS